MSIIHSYFAANVPDEYRLMHDLLHNYESTARPRFDSNHVVNVLVRFSLQQIYDLVSQIWLLTPCMMDFQ